MEELLTKLHDSLSLSFSKSLRNNEIHYENNGDSIDVFKTLINLKKNNNDLYELMLEGSLPIDLLEFEFDKELLNECLNNKYLLKGKELYSNKVFIGTNGLFELYKLKNHDLNEVFKAYDLKNLIIDKQLNLKSQEKIWCIFLLLFGADKKECSFDSEGLSPNKLKDYHFFFQLIEKELIDKGIILGKKIGWDTGKDSVFRKFITNNVDLPKTRLYFKDGKYKYYLNITSKKNAKYLINLILDRYEGDKRLYANDIFYDVLKDLNFKISLELGEIPKDLNEFIIQELLRS